MSEITMLARMRAVVAHIDRHRLDKVGSINLLIEPKDDVICAGWPRCSDVARCAVAWWDSLDTVAAVAWSDSPDSVSMTLYAVLEGWTTKVFLTLRDDLAAAVRELCDLGDSADGDSPVDMAVLRTLVVA